MIEVPIPSVGESITEVTLSAWLKQEGDFVAMDEAIAELETDKVSLELLAPQAGKLIQYKCSAGEVLKVGSIAAIIDETAQATTDTNAIPIIGKSSMDQSIPSDQNVVDRNNTTDKINKTLPPSARKLVADDNIDVSQLHGTGKHQQVTKEDIRSVLAQTAEQKSSSNSRVVTTDISSRERVEPMSKIRQVIANNLLQSQRNSATLTTFNEVDMHALMSLRSTYKEVFHKKHDIKLGFMSFFTMACVEALKQFPKVNAEIRGTDVVYKHYYDIGIAVGGPKGLVVPVIRNVDQLSIAEMERSLANLVQRIQDKKITLDELQGATFTISNGGIYGSMLSTPIINPPQVGILGMHNIVQRPVVVDGEIKIRPIMYLALSYDHRMIDGKEAVQFLVKIKNMIEDPARMMLDC